MKGFAQDLQVENSSGITRVGLKPVMTVPDDPKWAVNCLIKSRGHVDVALTLPALALELLQVYAPCSLLRTDHGEILCSATKRSAF